MYFRQYFQRKLTSDKLDAKVGQMACWFFSVFIMVGGSLKVTTLQLTEPQLFFGILAVSAVALLGIILGVLLPISQCVEQWQRDIGNR